IDGRRHELTSARTVIGRGSDAGITISDAGSSRRHAEVLWDGERAMLRDLGSTNGTKVDGQKVREAALTPGTVFTIGRTELTFRVVPVSASTGSGPSTGSDPSLPTPHSEQRSALPGASGARGPGSGTRGGT